MANPPSNPYPSGINVSGIGPNNSSGIWQTQWDPSLGTYVANTGFGVAPIYNASQFNQWTQGAGQLTSLPGLSNEGFTAAGGDVYLTDTPGVYTPGQTLSIKTPTGVQYVDYRLDPTTGQYVPSAAQGQAGGTPLIDQLIEGGAIAGAGVAGLGATGALGATTAGPGAAAIGGSVAPAAATAPAVGGFTGGLQLAGDLPASDVAGTSGLGTLGATDAAGGGMVGTLGQSGLAASTAGTAVTDPFALTTAPAAAGGLSTGGASLAAGGAMPAGFASGATAADAGILGTLKSGLAYLGLSPAQALLGGAGLISAAKGTSLPSQAGQLQSNINAVTPGAIKTIQSGGTASPQWGQQKSAIDAQIAQLEQQQSEALQQAAANSGMGNQNSAVVQQQLQQMKANLETERQQLYLQAQNQNVTQAISVMTGGNSLLAQLANLQMQSNQNLNNTLASILSSIGRSFGAANTTLPTIDTTMPVVS